MSPCLTPGESHVCSETVLSPVKWGEPSPPGQPSPQGYGDSILGRGNCAEMPSVYSCCLLKNPEPLGHGGNLQRTGNQVLPYRAPHWSGVDRRNNRDDGTFLTRQGLKIILLTTFHLIEERADVSTVVISLRTLRERGKRWTSSPGLLQASSSVSIKVLSVPGERCIAPWAPVSARA